MGEVVIIKRAGLGKLDIFLFLYPVSAKVFSLFLIILSLVIRKYLIRIASDPFVYTFSQACSGRKKCNKWVAGNPYQIFPWSSNFTT